MPPLSRSLLATHPFLETTDLDLVRAVTGRAWGRHSSEVVGRDRYRLRLDRAEGTRLAVTFVDCTARIETRMEGIACRLQVIVPLSGGIDIEIDRRTLTASPGRALLVHPTRSMRFVASPTRCLLVDLTEGMTGDGPLGPEATKRSSSGWTLAGVAGGRVVSGAIGLARLHDRLSHGRGVSGPPSGIALAEASLLGRIDAFLGGTTPPAGDGVLPERVVVEDLLGWLRGHCDADVTIADLARYAGVSARAVEQAFARHVGATPSECLRAMRLDLARAGLKHAAVGASVTAVALDAGFRHFGRFSADYRRRFGELPSETLERRRTLGP